MDIHSNDIKITLEYIGNDRFERVYPGFVSKNSNSCPIRICTIIRSIDSIRNSPTLFNCNNYRTKMFQYRFSNTKFIRYL